MYGNEWVIKSNKKVGAHHHTTDPDIESEKIKQQNKPKYKNAIPPCHRKF